MTGRWTSGKRRAGGKGVCALSDEPSNGSKRLRVSLLSPQQRERRTDSHNTPIIGHKKELD